MKIENNTQMISSDFQPAMVLNANQSAESMNNCSATFNAAAAVEIILPARMQKKSNPRLFIL